MGFGAIWPGASDRDLRAGAEALASTGKLTERAGLPDARYVVVCRIRAVAHKFICRSEDTGRQVRVDLLRLFNYFVSLFETMRFLSPSLFYVSRLLSCSALSRSRVALGVKLASERTLCRAWRWMRIFALTRETIRASYLFAKVFQFDRVVSF